MSDKVHKSVEPNVEEGGEETETDETNTMKPGGSNEVREEQDKEGFGATRK